MEIATDGFGPIVVKVPKACQMLACEKTRLYQLLAAGELESFLDGKTRKITVVSIHGYVNRRLEAEKGVPK